MIAKISPSENRIASQFQVMNNNIIAMQIEAAGILENAPHFQQPRRHHYQIAFHGFAVRGAGRINDGIQGRFRLGYKAV